MYLTISMWIGKYVLMYVGVNPFSVIRKTQNAKQIAVIQRLIKKNIKQSVIKNVDAFKWMKKRIGKNV